MKKLLLPILCVGLLFTGCGEKTIPVLENGEEVVAKLDGKDITANDLYSELKKQGGTNILVNLIDEFIANKEVETNDEASKFADAQIATLKAQYESYGEDFDKILKTYYDSIDELKEEIILDYKKNKVVENYVKSTISDKEVNNYYKNNVFGAMNVRYILVKPEVTDDMTDEEKVEAENKALDEAKDIIKKLKDGKKFEDLAKKHSDDASTASNGGLYEGFEKDEVVEEFWNASVSLKDNEYTKEPIKSSYGYFVISRISQDKKPTLEKVREDILTTLTNEKLAKDETLSTKAMIEVRKNYNLDIVDSDILSQYKKSIKDYE